MTTRHRRRPGATVTGWRRQGRQLLRAACFWTAVVLPGLLCGWLALWGVRSVSGLAAAVAALGVEVLALVGGRTHCRAGRG